MRGITSFVTGTQIDISSLAEYLPQLPSTRDEVQAIAKELQVELSSNAIADHDEGPAWAGAKLLEKGRKLVKEAKGLK